MLNDLYRIKALGDGNCAPRSIIQALLIAGLVNKKKDLIILWLCQLAAANEDHPARPKNLGTFFRAYSTLEVDQFKDFAEKFFFNSATDSKAKDDTYLYYFAACLRKAAYSSIKDDAVDALKEFSFAATPEAALTELVTLDTSTDISLFVPWLASKNIELTSYFAEYNKPSNQQLPPQPLTPPQTRPTVLSIEVINDRSKEYGGIHFDTRAPYPELFAKPALSTQDTSIMNATKKIQGEEINCNPSFASLKQFVNHAKLSEPLAKQVAQALDQARGIVPTKKISELLVTVIEQAGYSDQFEATLQATLRTQLEKLVRSHAPIVSFFNRHETTGAIPGEMSLHRANLAIKCH